MLESTLLRRTVCNVLKEMADSNLSSEAARQCIADKIEQTLAYEEGKLMMSGPFKKRFLSVEEDLVPHATSGTVGDALTPAVKN